MCQHSSFSLASPSGLSFSCVVLLHCFFFRTCLCVCGWVWVWVWVCELSLFFSLLLSLLHRQDSGPLYTSRRRPLPRSILPSFPLPLFSSVSQLSSVNVCKSLFISELPSPLRFPRLPLHTLLDAFAPQLMWREAHMQDNVGKLERWAAPRASRGCRRVRSGSGDGADAIIVLICSRSTPAISCCLFFG